MSDTLNDKQRFYADRLREPMVRVKPFMLPYLVQLGVVEEHAKTFTLARAYDVLWRLLGKRIRVKKGPRLTKLYWLWTNGVALDALASFSKAQADEMLKMIWANKRSQTPSA